MRFGVLLLAAICVLAPAGARADEGDPDWVFEFEEYYMSHFCDDNDGFTPYVDVAWEDVAYGVFEFDLWRVAAFETAGSVPCTLSYGGQQAVIEAGGDYECRDRTACYDKTLTAVRSFKVLSPTSAYDFTVSISSSYCYLHCGTIDCTPFGLLTGTLYLYAEPTAMAKASWGTIKARY